MSTLPPAVGIPAATLQAARTECRLSIARLATLANVSPRLISELGRGMRARLDRERRYRRPKLDEAWLGLRRRAILDQENCLNSSAARSLLSCRRPIPGCRTSRRAACRVLALSLTAAVSIHAQDYVTVAPVPGAVRTKITVVNAMLGATLGGARAWINHRPIRRGVALGALGGLTTAGARQVVATRRDGAGIFGRVLHDVGLGLGSAASDSTLTIPFHVGPLVARWTPATRTWPSVRVNLTNLVYAGVAIAQANASVDWRATLWSGAVVVLPVDRAYARPGTLSLTDVSSLCAVSPSGAPICRVDLAHESIHVLQLDMMHEWVGKDIEASLVRRLPGMRGLNRWVELGAVGPGSLAVLLRRSPYHRQWIEYEAYWLTQGSGPEP